MWQAVHFAGGENISTLHVKRLCVDREDSIGFGVQCQDLGMSDK